MKKNLPLFSLLLLAGCGPMEPGEDDAGTGVLPVVDSGVPADAGGNPDDAGGTGTDAGTDSGVTDAGVDAGIDAGVDAGGPADAGPGVELNPGWVGGKCSTALECSNPAFTAPATCQTTGFSGGMCTQACTYSSGSGLWVCPDAAQTGAGTLNTVTRCIDAAGSATCVSECDFVQSPTGCRPGYTCVSRQRYNQPSKIFKVCLPSTGQRWPGEPAPANDIGAACANPESCANNACLSLTGGYCTKMMCDLAGCPAGSTCWQIDSTGTTACLKSCAVTGDCRSAENYICDSDKTCWPTVPTSTWNPAVGPGDCTAAWGTAGSGLSTCDTLKGKYVVVHKSARNLALCNGGAHVANFRMGLGFAPSGDKVQEGDGKTPEGVFYVAALVPNSSYYKAFLVSYPDKADATRGLAAGLISSAEKTAIDTAQNNCSQPPQSTGLGGWIEIHGNGGTSDWTLGCMAIADTEIDQLWAALVVGDTIVVLP
ncbi:MAG: L,D-transpeptidase family protein [Myxococcaceae bacterium]